VPANPLQTTLLLRRRHARRPGPLPSPRLGIGLIGILLILLTLGFFGLAGIYAYLTADLPAPGQVKAYFDPQYGAFYHPTTLLDNTAEHTLLTLENPGIPPVYRALDPGENDHLSPRLTQITVSLLQPDFWQSPGFSFRHLTDPQPYTIAERLVDDLMLQGEGDGLRRALRMRLLAAQLISGYGRDQVLEWFLNEANFGHYAFGAGAAARLYLEQDASNLDLAGASLLIAILDAPALNPLDAPTAALERQRKVLLTLFESGDLPESEYQAARTEKLEIRRELVEEDQVARAFTRQVLDELSDRLGQERLERGGLIIRTTLDYDLQVQLVCTLKAQLLRLESGDLSSPVPEDCSSARLLPTLNLLQAPEGSDWSGSAVLLDPQTGQLLALVGDFTSEGESAALGAYPVGTLLSPLAAVGLFAGGYSPASLVWDIPASLPHSLTEALNPDGTFHGAERLRNALVNDHLAGLVGLMEQNGVASIWRRVEPLGVAISTGSDALYGSVALNPLQIAQAYAPLANSGVQAGVDSNGVLHPALILEVEAGGAVQEGFGSVQTQALLSPQLAYLAENLLSDEPARRSSLGYPNPLEIGRPAGAKVGQTAAGDDVWVAGFTPQRVAVVRLSRSAGEDQPRLDALLAAGVWHALMQTAMRDLPTLGWSQPAGISSVNVCNPSGLLPTANCPEVVSEVFLAGNEPTAPDDLYRKLQINRETGLLATVFTPAGLVEEHIYFNVPSEAREWAFAQGFEQPPTTYDLVQAQTTIPGVSLTSPTMFAAVHGEVKVRGTAAIQDMQSYTVQVGQGMNPSRWEEIGQGGMAINNGLLATWQTPLEDGLYAIRLVVVGKDMSVQITAVQVTVDNTTPQVRVTYPAAGTEISLSSSKTITLVAEVSDALGIQQVEWLLDGRSLGEKTAGPFTYRWTAHKGKHTLVVRATDLAGNVSESLPVEFEVK
jgi:membrane peptidoglycan carboxypeptidase